MAGGYPAVSTSSSRQPPCAPGHDGWIARHQRSRLLEAGRQQAEAAERLVGTVAERPREEQHAALSQLVEVRGLLLLDLVESLLRKSGASGGRRSRTNVKRSSCKTYARSRPSSASASIQALPSGS